MKTCSAVEKSLFYEHTTDKCKMLSAVNMCCFVCFSVVVL